METTEKICDICVITCKSSTDWAFAMQIENTDKNANYRHRYLFKDLCPRCASKILRYIKEQQYLHKEFIKHVSRKR